ncbi:MAG: uracil phosphoribosyltransferase [Deferribacteraceae bacterium]|jgi:uracil phosphoribosyltransferase|nr:uracil phosphoribosyltransferase [Deferribacteraceae bacterium]
MENYSNFHIVQHPLIQHKLTLIRDKKTSKKEFSELVNEVAMLMAYDMTKDLPLKEVEIETPIKKMKSSVVAGKKIVLMPILRAGIGMVNGILQLIPSARVGHIGIFRDEETLQPHTYFFKMPKDGTKRDIILIDPMLATGGSIIAAVDKLKERGCKNIKCLCLIVAPEGVKAFCEKHPDVPLYTAALDECLNEKGYIVPGLGDAGDRLFGTK